MAKNSKLFTNHCGRGFTLVELLVVIAIIGILVALLLPAVQTAREAGRRVQCTNQVRQMMLAMHNHVSARGVFPGGGIKPWPAIEDYSRAGAPFGPDKQGLSWAFQILPYLENQNIFELDSTVALENTPVDMYFCPSRRVPTRNPFSNAWLMDYAAVVPNRSRQQAGDALFNLFVNPQTYLGCLREEFWGSRFGPIHDPPTANLINSSSYYGFWGVIVRSNAWRVGDGYQTTGFYKKITFGKIKDGSSHTLVLAEKRLRPSQYQSGSWHDDRGWSDGWDPDTLRSTICPAGQDDNFESFNRDNPMDPTVERMYGFNLGSAHTSVFNAAFADGSVRQFNYNADIENMNQLAHRSDGAIVDTDGL